MKIIAIIPKSFIDQKSIGKIFLLILLLSSMLYSQSDYFPLEIGNTWTYDYYDDGEFMRQSSISVIDTLILEDKTYYLFDRYFYCGALIDSQLFRIDSTKVYRYENNHEQMFLDFSADVDDSWNIEVSDLDTLLRVKVVLASKTVNFSANGREFEDCYTFFFDHPASDISWAITVAPQVGCTVVYIGTLIPGEYWFRSGIINQIDYPDLVNNIDPHENFESAKNSVRAYPNPFNTTTIIRYQLAAVSDVDLSIYNILGQKIATLVSEKQSAGQHRVEWNASAYAAGFYFYKLSAGRYTKVRKLLLIR